jgi:hypothetical protein
MHLVLGSYEGGLIGLQVAAAQARRILAPKPASCHRRRRRSSLLPPATRHAAAAVSLSWRLRAQGDSLVSRRRFAYTPHSRFAASPEPLAAPSAAGSANALPSLAFAAA